MKRFCLIVILSAGILVLLLFKDCLSSGNNVEEAVSADSVRTENPYTMPEIPALLTAEEDRSAYLIAHYWDNFDFRDTSLISRPEITEQVLANYLGILPYGDSTLIKRSLRALMDSAAADSATFRHFMSLTEKYLFNPNSPMRNDEYYIPVLERIIASPLLEVTEKTRPRYRLAMALKNRPGAKAADFAYRLADGRTERMSSVRADYTVLFFNDPECEECKRAKRLMQESELLGSLMRAGASPSVKVVAVYPDEDVELWKHAEYPGFMVNGHDAGQAINRENLYDLRALPSLYLLDKNKRVILKDATVEMLLMWLGMKTGR